MVVSKEDILKSWGLCRDTLSEFRALAENYRAGRYIADLMDIGKAFERIKSMIDMEGSGTVDRLDKTDTLVFKRAQQIQESEGISYREALIIAGRER